MRPGRDFDIDQGHFQDFWAPICLDLSGSFRMNDEAVESVSPYLLSPARTLRDACRQTGHDNDGKRCPHCSLKDLRK